MLINRYLRSQLGFHIFLVMAVAGIIDLMTTTLSEWSYGLQGNYQALEAAWFILMTAPGRLYELFPLVVLIGCLTGLGALANSSELTIIRASGVSIFGLTYRIIVPVISILVFVGIVGELALPEIDKYAQSYRSQLSQTSKSTRYGVWHREEEMFIYISSATKDGHLEDVHILGLKPDGQPEVQIVAKTAEYVDNDWLLKDVEISRLGGDRLELVSVDSWRWHTDLTPKQLQNLTVPPEKLSIFQLFEYVGYLDTQGVSTEKYQLALWNKLLMPVMSLSLVIVAISFIFGPLREVATGTRVFVGVLIGLLLKMSQNILGPASLIFGFSPVISAVGPVMLTLFVGLYLLNRVF